MSELERAIRDIMDSRNMWLPAGSKIFWLDGSGNFGGHANHNGLDPDTPKLTMKATLALCENNRRDYIFVLDYPWAGGVTGEDEPIVVNKSTVTIVAAGRSAYNVPVIGSSGNTAAVSITAGKVKFIGLEFVTGAGATHGDVEIAATCFGLEFWDCLFDHDIRGPGAGGQDGITVLQTFDAVDLKVVGCIFGPGLSRDGIRVITNSTRGMIGLPGRPSNFFDRCPGYGLHLGVLAGVASMGIFDNRFACHSDAVGKAIYIPLGSDGFIDGNHANYGVTAMTQNPYRDLGANHWGVNWKAGVSIMPAVA